MYRYFIVSLPNRAATTCAAFVGLLYVYMLHTWKFRELAWMASFHSHGALLHR